MARLPMDYSKRCGFTENKALFLFLEQLVSLSPNGIKVVISGKDNEHYLGASWFSSQTPSPSSYKRRLDECVTREGHNNKDHCNNATVV